ncbi:MAG: MltA domain-containing protein, partial [Gammaproteobacteria bacterium]
MKPFRASPWLLVLMLSACGVLPPAPTPAPKPVPPPEPAPPTAPAVPPALLPTPAAAFPTLKAVDWPAIEFWQSDAAGEVWPAFLQSCSTLVKRSAWQAICLEAQAMPPPDDATVRAFFEQRFQPWQATQEDGSEEGLVTGYYEPLLKGDRVRTERARYPLYAAPDDLITVDLASVYPELRGLRLRGRLVG